MEPNQKLISLLAELEHLTGVRMDVSANSSEETDLVIEQLQRICNAYKEKYSKEHFLKNIIYGNLSLHELAKQASHFHINPAEKRVVLLLETKTAIDQAILSIIKHLVPMRTGTYTIPVSDNRVLILIPASGKNLVEKQIKFYADNVIETLNTEVFTDGWIACGPTINHLSELANVFQKLTLTLTIGHIFYSEQNIFFYNHLGVARLIHELPISACNDFLGEVFSQGLPVLDSELTNVTNCFFENNLNIAESARQLHMHRNTLIYRLEQVEQMTGLNLRNFEDAVIFKIALMIMKRSTLHE